ncbi:MAG: hypothetical protein V4543_00805 [Bacteroidota bacterium]
MPQFRKKRTITVEAFLYSGYLRFLRLWFEDIGAGYAETIDHSHPLHPSIITPKGLVGLPRGHYIIRKANGKFYSCPADVFHELYEQT